MKYYIIAGEPSGDLHGSLLVRHLKRLDEKAVFRGFGGDKMRNEGVDLSQHIRSLAFMGLWDVVKNLDKVSKNLSLAKRDILSFKPDVVILIDYPGFNLKIAEFAKKNGFKVFYYIPPKVWAWKQKRVFKIKRFIDEVFVIFPFEVEFYRKFGINVHYFGNPLIDIISEFERNFNAAKRDDFKRRLLGVEDKKLVALLPGSRKQEIEKILPYYEKLAVDFDSLQFVIAGMSYWKDLYRLKSLKNLKIVFDKTYELLSVADFAIVTSGTATLETALFNVPQVVTFLPGKLTYFLGKMLVKIPYISLVNIIYGDQVVPEVINSDFYPNLKSFFVKMIEDRQYLQEIYEKYGRIREMLGEPPVVEKVCKELTDRLL